VAFSPDGKQLAAAYSVRVGASPWVDRSGGQGGTFKGSVVVWDLAEKKRAVTSDCGGSVQLVAYSGDGKLLAVQHIDAAGASKVRTLDSATGNERRDLTRSEEWGPDVCANGIAFSPDGKSLVVGTSGGRGGAKLLVFDPWTGKVKKSAGGWDGLLLPSLTFSADGKLLASVREDVVQVWDADTLKERNSFTVLPGNAAALAPDGRSIAVSTIGSRKYGGKIALTLCDAATGKERIDFKCLRGSSSFVFTPDGGRLIAGSFPGLVTVYDTATGKSLAVVDGPSVNSLALSPKGDILATGNQSGTIWLWDLRGLK
jgi:WD40 repeat protein